MLGLTHHCFSCLAGLAYSTLNRTDLGDEQRYRLIKDISRLISENFSRNTVPSHLGTEIQRLIQKEIKLDLFAAVKEKDNRVAEKIVASLPRSELSFSDLVKLAIIGNVIDSALYRSAEELLDIESVLSKANLVLADLDDFRTLIDSSKKILYLTDNCGEIIFDRLLLEWLRGQGKDIYLSPKSEAICNDATRADIINHGLDQFVAEVIAVSPAMGLNLAECDERFLAVWRSVDIIISKGMGNFEALWGRPEKIAFLFKAKCQAVASSVNVELNADLLLLSQSCKS